MHSIWQRLRRVSAAGGLAAAASVFCAGQASAHVKWFCAFNVAGQPRGLENVLCPDFEVLMLTAFTLLLFGYAVEWSPIGAALTAAINRVTRDLRDETDVIIRAACGFFLIACWANGGVILTPELKTASPIIPWIQLALAAGLLWRETLIFTALGLVGLFGYAIYEYGIFHLLDYPIFLGLAAYLALTGRQGAAAKKAHAVSAQNASQDFEPAQSPCQPGEIAASESGRDGAFYGVRPLDIARWSIAVTLMWASIEKWAYPQWTYPLFITHPDMSFGFEREFYMRAAGMVEFTLSFALLLTPFVRRVAAVILCTMFVSAVPEFGKIDAIGHAPIIGIVLGMIADHTQARRPVHLWLGIRHYLTRLKLAISAWDILLIPAAYCLALASFLTIYYVLHSALYGTHLV
jgi:hypothetical protein